MPSPRLFGRDPSKQPGDEPGRNEIDEALRRAGPGDSSNSVVTQDLVNLNSRGKRVEQRPGD